MKPSIYKVVEEAILNNQDYNRIWSNSDFENLSVASVSKALSILCQKNIIKRIEKGYYYRPKMTVLGETVPDYLKLTFLKLEKKQAFYCISGISGFNNIGLTTQVPNITVIACDCPMKNSKGFKFIRRKRPHSGTAIERIILDALIDIDRISDTTTSKNILKIKRFIISGKVDINDLGISAKQEPARVKAVIGALGQELGMNKNILNNLKNSLKSKTSIIGIESVLKYAKFWNIK